MGVYGHWNMVYETNALDRVSWYEGDPQVSLELIASVGLGANSRIADVGAACRTFLSGGGRFIAPPRWT